MRLNYLTNILFAKILYFLTRISFSEGLNPFLHRTPIHFAKRFSWSVGNVHFRPTFRRNSPFFSFSRRNITVHLFNPKSFATLSIDKPGLLWFFVNSFQHDLFWPIVFNNPFYISWSRMIGCTNFWLMCIFSLLNIKWRTPVCQNSFAAKFTDWVFHTVTKNYIDSQCLLDFSWTFSILQSNSA